MDSVLPKSLIGRTLNWAMDKKQTTIKASTVVLKRLDSRKVLKRLNSIGDIDGYVKNILLIVPVIFFTILIDILFL